jgi:hypothetical protein
MSHVVFGEKLPGEKGSVRWCVVMMNSQFIWRQFWGRGLLLFSHSRRKASYKCAELTVWPARTILFANNPFDVKESDEHALDFALHLSHLFRSILIPACHSNTPARAFFTEFLSTHCLVLRRFAKHFHKIRRCSLAGSIAKSHQARNMTRNKRILK